MAGSRWRKQGNRPREWPRFNFNNVYFMSMKHILRDFKHKKGVHSDTAALRDIFAFEGHRLPEELFFGLGEGLGFYYWNGRNLTRPMIGGRCGNLELDRRVCERLGAGLAIKESSSQKRARETLISLLEAGRPVMVHTDAYYLEFLRSNAHFGAHCLVVAGVDGDTAYVADRSRDGLIEMSLDKLSEARSSRHKPFPPQNRWFEIDVPAPMEVNPEGCHGRHRDERYRDAELGHTQRRHRRHLFLSELCPLVGRYIR